MSILLILLLISSVVVATIHQDRRQAFRCAAERLPEELEDRIWEFYLELIYGDNNPKSPILSLEETQAQALFSPLHFVNRWEEETVWYKSDLLNQTMTKDRYLTLYVTAEPNDSNRHGRNDGQLFFKTDSNCQIEMRYFVVNGTVHQWSDEAGFFFRGTGHIEIDMLELNRAHEPGTEILLYIPQGCTLTLLRMLRTIFSIFHILPRGISANISWATSVNSLPTSST